MKRHHENQLNTNNYRPKYKPNKRFFGSASEIIQRQLASENPTPYSNALSLSLFGEKKIVPYHESLRNAEINSRQYHKSTDAKYSFNLIQSNLEVQMPYNYYYNMMDWGIDGCVYFGTDDLFAYNGLTNTLHSVDHDKNPVHNCITAVCSTPNKILYSADDDTTGSEILASRDTETCKNISAINTESECSYVIRNKDLHVFYAGNSEGLIAQVDFRSQTPLSYLFNDSNNKAICSMSICGNLIATGDDDNLVHLWDIRKPHSTLMTLNMHKAAVKALAFSPYNNSLLASGGGTDDPTIHITNIQTQKIIKTHRTDSQVCNVHWVSRNTLLTTHGFGNCPKINFWKITKEKQTFDIVAKGPIRAERFLFSTINPNNPYEFLTGIEGEDCKHYEIKEQVQTESKRIYTIR